MPILTSPLKRLVSDLDRVKESMLSKDVKSHYLTHSDLQLLFIHAYIVSIL